jgi:DNA-binding response OmpR family regulator
VEPSPLPLIASPAVLEAKVVLVGRDDAESTAIRDILQDASLVIVVGGLLDTRFRTEPQLSSAGRRASRFGDLRIDPSRHEVKCRGIRLAVTQQEFGILTALVEGGGAARAYYELSDRGDSFGDHDWMRSAIKRLRRKLRWAGSLIEIEAVRGYGFRLKE